MQNCTIEDYCRDLDDYAQGKDTWLNAIAMMHCVAKDIRANISGRRGVHDDDIPEIVTRKPAVLRRYLQRLMPIAAEQLRGEKLYRNNAHAIEHLTEILRLAKQAGIEENDEAYRNLFAAVATLETKI